MILWSDLALVVVHISVKIFQGAVFPKRTQQSFSRSAEKFAYNGFHSPAKEFTGNVSGKTKPWNFG